MISVVIPAYIPTKNHHSLLLRAMKSLENQSFNEFEVICVLNGCYASYDEIIHSLSDNRLNIKFVTLNGKTSGAVARNFGVKHCNFPLIAQLDADDQYHPDKLKKQLEFFSMYPNYDFVGTLAYDFYHENDIKNSCYSPGEYMTHDQISNALNYENIMCHGSVAFKKSSFESLDGYNEKNKPGEVWPELGIRMWEDWDLWRRAIKKNMLFFNIPERLYYWSVGTSVER